MVTLLGIACLGLLAGCVGARLEILDLDRRLAEADDEIRDLEETLERGRLRHVPGYARPVRVVAPSKVP